MEVGGIVWGGSVSCANVGCGCFGSKRSLVVWDVRGGVEGELKVYGCCIYRLYRVHITLRAAPIISMSGLGLER